MTAASLLLAAAVAGRPAGSALDYFPLNQGDEYTYLDESTRQKWTIVDRVAAPAKISGKDAGRVDSYLGSKSFGSTYYYVDSTGVYVAAQDPEKPLPEPLPIFRMPGAPKWSFEGVATMLDQGVPIKLEGSSREIKPVKFGAITRDAVEVTIKVDDGTIKTEQISVYAKGIGLIEMKETTQIVKAKQNRVRRLIGYKPAKAGG